MRDISFVVLNEKEYLVCASDFSAGIGMLEKDTVRVPNGVLASFTARTAFMEVLAAGAKPIAVTIQNGCKKEAWSEIKKNVTKVAAAAEAGAVDITGSTETNMPVVQSSLGVTVVGTVKIENLKIKKTPNHAVFAAVGEPLVGKEVILHKEKIISWPLFFHLLRHEGVYEIIPCGSKGIGWEWDILLKMNGLSPISLPKTSVDINKSCGPATSIVISYDQAWEAELHKLAGKLFYKLGKP